MATLVKFRYNKANNDLFAYFPQLRTNLANDFTCYSHVGQHSSASPAYVRASDEATPEQYADLKTELESIGYTLKICK